MVQLDESTRKAILPQLEQVVRDIKEQGVAGYQRHIERLAAAHDKYHDRGDSAGSFDDDAIHRILSKVNEDGKVRESVGTDHHQQALIEAVEREIKQLN